MVVPAYRCRAQVARVVGEVKQAFPGAVTIVVDDGSGDGTGEAAQKAGAYVLSHARNQGKGVAVRTGLAEAVRRGAEIIVTLDGDGQHRAEDAARLAALVERAAADLAVGNRMGDPRGMPWDRRLSNRLSSLVVSIACQRWVPDSQCGLRALSARLAKGLPLTAEHFEIETEMLLAAAKAKARVQSVPVQSIYPEGEDQPASNIARLRDTLRFLRLLILFFLRWG
ncbi:MAG: glycosyltransferase family 2 protein [candidate division KSB1 bacterium]|nr:glycosyltransferase family 2 protein [candidate division KSB1 bacterium]